MPSKEFVPYHYLPSLPAAAVFVAVFAISTLIHLYQCLRTRAFYMIPLIVGGALEVTGYVFRIKSRTEAPDYSLGGYIVQATGILIAPAFTAAIIYIAFGRIVLVVNGDSLSPIRQKFLTIIFVSGDVLSLVVQSNGASIITQKKRNSATIGKWIITIGLIVQVIFFALFMVISIIFYRRLSGSPTPTAKLIPGLWRKNLYYLYAASVLIMIRSMFRVVEYVQGNDGYLLSHEIFLYLLDATLMATVMLLFNVFHPTMITAHLNGTKATHMLRVRTLVKLGGGDYEDIPDLPLQPLRPKTGFSGNAV
ncbi:MAG: hypothetical protein Q9160_001219 [Pyrenula sp. 1 TL-2023]